ncbi:hypothetical protein [Spiroplasma endosymbiont of Virgichneumon dumeticola]|uniref:hypothetical protein n=1 Tax=Spiroplasma endosymbiont of Virgichneumon dumeticola TaxID=3139323 RepID=UPI0035C8A9B4
MHKQVVLDEIEKKKQEKFYQDKIKENEMIKIIITNKLIVDELCNFALVLSDQLMKKVVFQSKLMENGFNYLSDFSPHVLVEETMKLNEFNNTFQTEKQCLAYIASLKQSKCIRCSSFNLNTSNLRKMRCLKCHQTFSILTGTIFSKSQTPLISWFYLIFRWINTKHGIPSTDVAKELGVTLKTAWRMGHKIRSAIAKQEPQFIVEGIVQMDEMYLSHMGLKNKEDPCWTKPWLLVVFS